MDTRALPEPPESPESSVPVRVPEPVAGRWRMRIEVDEPDSRVVAAIDDDGDVIGLAAAGVTRDHDRATDWELYSINVTAQQQGSGMADALIRLAAADTDTTVWVRRDNARAQGFYARHGFTVEGATTLDEVTGVGEIRMVRRCAKR